MKKIALAILVLIISQISFGQHNGSWRFGNSLYSGYTPVVIAESQYKVAVNYNSAHTITIKGMYNITPDAYVAVFSLSQEGEDESDVNRLINKRINNIDSALKRLNSKISLNVDIISFVPLYESILSSKIFSKKTYVERPKGFELKKNIHIKYTNSNELNDIFTICSKNEVYDFVRVDLLSNKMDRVRDQLRERSDSMVYKQLARYTKMLDIDIKDYKRTLSEGYKVVYPAEKYLSYIAFAGTSYFSQKYNIKNTKKKNTQHYMPVIDKEFDFVVNPIISEPVIQVMYTINLALTEKPEPPLAPKPPEKPEKPEKQFFIITPEGKVTKLP
jgi:hypothetical protein